MLPFVTSTLFDSIMRSESSFVYIEPITTGLLRSEVGLPFERDQPTDAESSDNRR
jgi:hypothetical protein